MRITADARGTGHHKGADPDSNPNLGSMKGLADDKDEGRALSSHGFARVAIPYRRSIICRAGFFRI